LAEVTVKTAGFTVKVELPVAGVLFTSPAKLAVMGYDPAAKPVRLAVTDARPVASVIALPTGEPLSVKLTVLPASGPAGVVRVAESVVLALPYVALAGATPREVVAGWATVTLALAELLAAFASTAELLLMLAVSVVTVPSGIAVPACANRVTVCVSPLCSR
jgi:hypothetical protein